VDPVRLLLELAPLKGEEARGAFVAERLPGARRDGLGNVFAGEGEVLLWPTWTPSSPRAP
jgi:tripeptide aminopeptidase